ncbi:Esterase/lipase/thioesterase [Trichormus variabilis ATCC 29413]|uniref:Esterase/lipase/thioesterase n=2 Tax=Anabaena variabilis TaxID=264691 RepID=Q3MD59_TRIV2|nr:MULTISPECIES: alpha/beta hydrolase [Nostocaceae]ABA21077.1 Esterase/lipase/thioesterase [Trichormus variabilis ATCC 29413]MBC1215783.1 alpha/beta fold hydrolase [Trichormus variabilis ARAD]MBC1258238.1 alpha/beta fold hydrolase [Trichormus variabilis V5]MBC1269259.1 alpha/beta fold hydrolase [Trichormus variabilis FSR]MBC1302341.1 alpha/beta fold hydrolase [Trichormus variabilis N2B]
MPNLLPSIKEVFSIVGILLSFIGLFLSIWIIIPAPIYLLLPLGVGAPEVCHWSLLLNATAFALLLFRLPGNLLQYAALSISIVGIILSITPLLQIPTTQQQMQSAMEKQLGKDYLKPILEQKHFGRSPMMGRTLSHPFNIIDAFKGIHIDDVRYTPNIEFASPDGISLRLNIYRPQQIGKYPGIVVIHGGGWQSGSPENNADFSRYMAARGYTVFAITYRYAPTYKFPAQLDDVRSALTFIQQHATEYETDINRIAILGRSAGGQLAMLTAYQQNALPIRAVISYYAPSNLAKGYREPPTPDPLNVRSVLEAFLGGTPDQVPEQYTKASPINYVNRPLPPTLLIHGGRDHIIQIIFPRTLFQSLQNSGNKAILLEIPWAEHAFDYIFNGASNQLALYHTERFLAWALQEKV